MRVVKQESRLILMDSKQEWVAWEIEGRFGELVMKW